MNRQKAYTNPSKIRWTIGLVVIASFLILPGCSQVSEREAQERELIAAGRASFRAYCAGCHGPTAKGNGPAAEYMTIHPADLTQISKRRGGSFPAEEVYRRIDGAREAATTEPLQQMPHFGDIWRGMNPDWDEQQEADLRIKELVEYLRSIQEE